MRKWLLALALVLVVGLTMALLAWVAAGDARQAALLDARVRQAEGRAIQAHDRFDQLRRDKAPAEEVRQAEHEWAWADTELDHLRFERERRQEASWPARLRAEVRRRTGW